jgi:hypothetical protein
MPETPSFAEMLEDPLEQFDVRSELLASIVAYASAPMAAVSTVPRPRNTVWLYERTESDTPDASVQAAPFSR